MSYVPISLALICMAVAVVGTLSQRRNLPPGPPSLPFLGNGWRAPTENSWVYFHSLCQKYGSMLTIKGVRQTTLVLDKLEDVQELLVRRSGNYSSRKQLIYAGKYRSANRRIIMLPYGLELKKQRSAIHTMTNPKVVGGYERLQEDGSLKLLSGILDNPGEAYMTIKRFTSGTLLNIIYGKTYGKSDEDLHTLLQILRTVIVDIHPFRHWVDAFPILDWLPDFLAPWRAEALRKGEFDYQFYDRLSRDIKTRLDSGEEVECFAARLWENKEEIGLDERSMAFVAGSSFEAGTDNTASGILWFLVAAMHSPAVVNRAREEIDQLLGAEGDVVPAFRHLAQLPYCLALVKEVLRWAPLAPLAAPHHSVNDDTYKGFYIGAGTAVIPNIWAIHHDHDLYPEPHNFKPERFLTKQAHVRPEALIEGHHAFGFGRRQDFVTFYTEKVSLMFIWAFHINPPLDSNNVPIVPDTGACRPGLTSEPAPFHVSLTPRSKRHIETIRQGC